MLAAKNKRKIRADHKQHPIPPTTTPNDKNALKRLSFSFYGEETLKRRKQIILDNCDLITDLPILTDTHR